MSRLRPAQSPPKPPTQKLKRGCYLTDEKRLWRVLDACEGHVVLEDCGKPNQPACCMAADEVLDAMRLVRPQNDPH